MQAEVQCCEHFHLQITGEIDGKSKEWRYAFDALKAIQRLRFPKFLAHARATLGEKAEKVLEAVLDHGRITWAQLRQACPQLSDDALKEAGDQLLREKYVSRVLATPSRASAPPIVLPSPVSKAGTGKKRKAADDSDQPASKMRRGETGESVLAGGGAAAFEEEEQTDSLVEAESVRTPGSVWCVKAAAFEWDFTALAIEKLMEDRYGVATAALMKLLLRSVRGRALQPRNKGSSFFAISIDALLAQQKASREEIQPSTLVSWEGLSDQLTALSQDSFNAVQKVHDLGGAGQLYRPQTAKLISCLQEQIVEQLIEKRYQSKGRRLFRLLLDRCSHVHPPESESHRSSESDSHSHSRSSESSLTEATHTHLYDSHWSSDLLTMRHAVPHSDGGTTRVTFQFVM